MRVADAIAELTKLKSLDQEIIIAWWTREDAFSHIEEDDWNECVPVIEDDFDWSSTHDSLDYVLSEFIKLAE